MRVGILGAGALGGLFGGYLAADGADVTLVDVWEDHVAAINAEGLLIERPDRDDLRVTVPATTDPDSVGPVDVLFVFVKSHHTREALRDAATLHDEGTLVVTLQNGLTNMDTIREFVAEERLLGGATTMGSSTEGPGHLLHTGWGETKLGGVDRSAAERIARMLNAADLRTTVVDDPEPHIWSKQFVSVGIKPVAALTGLLDGPLSELEEPAHVMETLVTEAAAVARAKGIEILLDDPVAETHRTCRINYDTTSSMLEDVTLGRRTEIDHINGAIVEYGEEVGVDTPYNRMATALVKGKEHSY
ncbi:ketopantoate reductase family protein [Halomarina halobia]|uniref:2-dehydropantoate 2-reductase n=1 Tax=Halomarina halobia TaxID=3033386 RepID=A0ABD6ACX2_9EURY|nr:2-dehydropantoate 2-reductase [Halomarina sp. PSR21]